MQDKTPQHDKIYAFGAKVNFGKTSSDYTTHRAGFPDAFFQLLQQQGWVEAPSRALDIGTGTGTVARGLAALGCKVTGIDPSDEMLDEARRISPEIRVLNGKAESLPFKDNSFDLVTAGQCWHWFDRAKATCEISRVLRPKGRIIIAHFDWLPLKGNLVAATESLILKYNPEWAASGGTGVYPVWLTDLGEAGFEQIQTVSFDVLQPYSPEGWRGRIRASAGVAASLSVEDVARFDSELKDLLARDFSDEVLTVPHRVWIATATKS